MNRVTLVGNLGREPEMKELTDGIAVAKFSLATTEVYRLKSGETKADTQWHTIVLWRSLARLAAEYLRKGSLVMVEGKISYRSYEEGEETKYVTEIIADRLLMLDKRVIDRPADNVSFDYSDGNLPF